MSRSRIMPDEQGNSSPVFHLLTSTLFICTLTGSRHGQGIKIAKWNKETFIELQSAYADLPSTCLESFIQLAVCKVHFACAKPHDCGSINISIQDTSMLPPSCLLHDYSWTEVKGMEFHQFVNLAIVCWACVCPSDNIQLLTESLMFS